MVAQTADTTEASPPVVPASAVWTDGGCCQAPGWRLVANCGFCRGQHVHVGGSAKSPRWGQYRSHCRDKNLRATYDLQAAGGGK